MYYRTFVKKMREQVQGAIRREISSRNRYKFEIECCRKNRSYDS